MFILIFLITLLILILSHELGHFLMAKRFGIKVLEFGFGIPPRVFAKRMGETLISLNLLPIGGFVRLLGEDEVSKEILKDERSFAHQKVHKRIMVVVSGVVMNLILSWLLFYIVLIAQDFKVIYPTIDPVVVVADLEEGFPAKAAGVKVGQRLLEVNSKKITSIGEAIGAIKKQPNQRLKLTFADLEGKEEFVVEVVPKEVTPGEGLIGVVFSPVPFKKYQTFPQKIFSGIGYSYDLTKLTFAGLGKLMADLYSKDFEKASQSVAGPVGLLAVTKNIFELGAAAILPYLWFMGVISLTLTIFNLLPFPALDGGRLIFLFIELIMGKRINPEFERLVHTVGMTFLLALIALIAFSDIKKFF